VVYGRRGLRKGFLSFLLEEIMERLYVEKIAIQRSV
jgi:hypothetical protein